MVFVTALREVRKYLAAHRSNGKERVGGHNAGTALVLPGASMVRSSKSFLNDDQCPKGATELLYKCLLCITVFCAL